MPEIQIDAYCVNAKGTELYQLSSDLNGTIVTLAFHPPLVAGANILVRLRARIVMKPPSGDTFVGVFTVSVQADQILLTSHGLTDGNHIRFALADPLTCALPTPLAETSSYYVTQARRNVFSFRNFDKSGHQSNCKASARTKSGKWLRDFTFAA
jgi:hypothetical protein